MTIFYFKLLPDPVIYVQDPNISEQLEITSQCYAFNGTLSSQQQKRFKINNDFIALGKQFLQSWCQ